MKHEEVKHILGQDPGFVAAEKRLRPILDIANDVLHLRTKKGWTQQELAKRAGTRQAKISQLENGQGNTTLKLLQKVAEALDEELSIRIGAQIPAQQTSQPPVDEVTREIKVA